MNKSFDYYCEIGLLRYFVQYVWEKTQKILFLPSGDLMVSYWWEITSEAIPWSYSPQNFKMPTWRFTLGFPKPKKKVVHVILVVTIWKFWVIYRLDPSYTQFVYLFGGFLKWWYPTTMGFPTKNDPFGVFWGYHHLRKHPFLQKHVFTTRETLAQVRRNHGTEFHVGWSTVPKCTILCHFKRTCFLFGVGKFDNQDFGLFCQEMFFKQNTWTKILKKKMWYLLQHIPSPKKQQSCSKAKKNWWRKKRDSNHITYINPKPKRFFKFRGCF